MFIIRKNRWLFIWAFNCHILTFTYFAAGNRSIIYPHIHETVRRHNVLDTSCKCRIELQFRMRLISSHNLIALVHNMNEENTKPFTLSCEDSSDK